LSSDADDAASFDRGLLTPVAVGHDAVVSDDGVLAALVRAELGLVRAWSALGALPGETADSIAEAWESLVIDVDSLAEGAVGGGNPVIPLVPLLKNAVPPEVRTWIHRGATSQDIVDTALMLISRRAVDALVAVLTDVEDSLSAFAAEHRDVVSAARTLAQHAVPTTVGYRAVGWLSGIRRASVRLRQLTLPVQLGGAAGTRASFLELGGPAAGELPERYAEALGLDHTVAVWHTSRWPVTELADALAQTTDALGKLAADVVTLSRTEIAEVSAGVGGGSSAMPHKSNPVAAVLIRSAALRAPQLAATLHLCAALAADERPAGAWHAEWPTLRELLRIALGAATHAAQLTATLRVDPHAVARNLALTRGLLVSERLSIVLTPLIGAERVAALVAAAGAGGDLAELIRDLPECAGLDIPDLLDPAAYTGDARAAVDRATTPADGTEEERA